MRLIVASVFLVFVAVGHNVSAAKWSITHYEVVQEQGTHLEPEQVQAIEEYMHRVALYFQRQGWPEPRHEAVNASRTAFLVYAQPFDSGPAPPRALPDCTNPAIVTRIFLDPRHFGQTPNKDWQDLAHEIFHTIQYNYPLFNRDCTQSEIGDWVTEATAEAVGIEAARSVAQVTPYHFCQIGMRSYSDPLYVKGNRAGPQCPSDAYATSSFWQFLGEWNAKGDPPTPQVFTPPDFIFLDKLFRERPPSFGAEAEYEWLDKGLKNALGINLNRAYSAFSGTFIGYYKYRKSRYPKLSQSSEEGWRKQLFGGCPRATISSQPFNLSIAIKPFAARCIEAIFLTSGQHNLEIVANGPLDQIRALTISLGNGMQRVEPILRPEVNPRTAHFSFKVNVKAAGSQYLVVSNAALSPAKTKQANVILDFISASTGSSSAALAQPPSKSNSSRSSNSKSNGDHTSDSNEAFSDEFNETRQSSSWQGTLRQIDRGRTCDGAFVTRVCGERTRIRLRLASDAVTALSGALDTLSIGTATRRADQIQESDGVSELVAREQELANTEGSEVTITLPLVRYGQTGTITNAYIQMNKALNDRAGSDFYDSKGPEWQGGCNDGHHAYTGRVSIDEASEAWLRGRFEARVVEPDLREKYYCREVPVYKSISGDFVITNPRLLDEEGNGEIAEGQVEHIINEVSERVPGLVTPQMQEAIRARAEQAEQEKIARRKAKAEAAAIEAQSCNCECRLAGQTITKPGCYEQCETQYEQCTMPNGDQIRQLYELTRPATSDEEAEFEEMRVELLRYLEREPKRYVRDTWIQQFDKSPHFMKQKLLDSVRDRYGD